MPQQFLKQQPAEAAFGMSLLHPQPGARPSLQEVMQHERLAVVCEALRQRRRALQQQEASSESEVLGDFLRIMQVGGPWQALQLAAAAGSAAGAAAWLGRRGWGCWGWSACSAAAGRPHLCCW